MFFAENIAVMTEINYAESLRAEFDIGINSEAFNIYIEDLACEYHDISQLCKR